MWENTDGTETLGLQMGSRGEPPLTWIHSGTLVCAQTPCTRMCPIRPAAALCSLTPWGPFVPDSQALEPLNLMLLPHLMRVGKVGWKSGPLSVCDVGPECDSMACVCMEPRCYSPRSCVFILKKGHLFLICTKVLCGDTRSFPGHSLYCHHMCGEDSLSASLGKVSAL